MSHFVHPQGICESGKIGDGTRVWAFAHVLPGAVVGADCNLCDGVFVENDVVLGDRVTVKCGVQLWDGLRVGNDVFIGPNATFTNDRFPRSKAYQASVPQTVIGAGASVGAGAVVLPGLSIGRDAMIGAGAVVTHDVPARAIVKGNPARITGYVDTTAPAKLVTRADDRVDQAVVGVSVPGVTLYRLNLAADLRGSLAVAEFGRHVPFPVQRSFIVYGVPSKDVRGAHAHRRCEQFLLCVNGSMAVVVDDGHASEEIILDSPARGLHVPPMVWAVQYKHTADAVLVVFASEHYDADDYIREYETFLEEAPVCRSSSSGTND